MDAKADLLHVEAIHDVGRARIDPTQQTRPARLVRQYDHGRADIGIAVAPRQQRAGWRRLGLGVDQHQS